MCIGPCNWLLGSLCLGLVVFLTLWPLFFILHYTGIETFELPSGYTVVYLLINSWIGVLSLSFLRPSLSPSSIRLVR